MNWTRNSTRAEIKWNLNRSFDKTIDYNLFDYPNSTWRVIKLIYKPGIFFGLGTHGYYSLDVSKKQKLTTKNFHKLKLNIKKDSRFFFGLVISRHLNFLSSTFKIWNVIYNEIIEKTFPIFSMRNTLVSELQNNWIKHFLSFFLKRKWNKKRFFSIWNHPRMVSRITLVN